jgi:simple sugar transport system ATP-binding protein
LQQEGISILFVSHKLDEVFEISEKITILRNGHNVIDGYVSEFDRAKFVYYMTGRNIEENHFAIEQKEQIQLLRVENLSKKGGFKNVSFELNSGEVIGVTGLLGSGRTELALSLFGLNSADSGAIYIENKLTKINTVQDAVKNKIGYVPEDRLTEGLFLEQSIGRNIIVSIIEKLLSRFKLLDRRQSDNEMNNWIKSLSIVTPSHSLPVKVLSGGNQQRVVLAKWLANNPKILILNAPTVGVDIGSKSDIHQIIRELAQEGVGIIIISDDLPEVLNNCSKVLVMKKGVIISVIEDVSSITERELAQMLSDIA